MAKSNELLIKTLAGVEYKFRPVPMKHMPSENAVWWLRFQGRHISGTSLSEDAQSAIQAFMRKHQSEALTDGSQNYTLAGGMLALCNPAAVQ